MDPKAWNLGARARRATRTLGRSSFRILTLLATLAILAAPLASSAPATAQREAPATESLQPYTVKLGDPTALVEANAPVADLVDRARQHQRDDVAAALDALRASGRAGSYRYDDTHRSFQVTLSADAAASLAASPGIASVEPGTSSPNTTNPTRPGVSAQATATSTPVGPTTVSSVNFIQVYSPFMWGRVSIGGLTINLTLEDSNGNTIGVPTQTYQASPNYVQIDRTQLYYETVFVDPNNSTHPPVIIVPGDKVHAVTSDPGSSQVDDRTITVDNVQAWTSYLNNTVTGSTSATNAPVVITESTSLSTASYLTPGSSMTYATTTSDGSGNFSVSKFVTTTNQTPATVDLVQGSTGFVRVQHGDGNEVYTVHGQNVLVLENSAIVHGYAFPIPSAPSGLDSGVAVSRPAPTVSVTLTSPQAQTLSSSSFTWSSNSPYLVTFPTTISGGDIVTVTINQGPANVVTTSPLSATVDLANNQVSGSGPPNTSVTVGAGRIDGYITSYSTFTYVQDQLTTSTSGSFATGPIGCGTSSTLLLQPGSFGYVGYEDGHGNFTYEDYAAPRNDVMANYPFVEGWVANGTVQPTVTVEDPSGNVLSQTAVTPLVLYLTNQKLYLNLYYNLTPPEFIAPGDTVVVNGGSRTDTIPVDNLTAYVDTDADLVVGSAPSGGSVKVIPYNAKTVSQTAVANSSNAYTAGNPFTSFSDSSCTTSTSTQSFSPGAVGRAYLAHSDGNTVFATWGREMHVNENENFVELYYFPTQNLDWSTTPQWSPSLASTVTVTKLDGSSASVACPTSGSTQCTGGTGLSADTKAYVLDSQGQKVLIYAGYAVSATFTEGPPAGPNRSTTLSLTGIPLITGSPDLTTETVAGVGPVGWDGLATLNSPLATTMIPSRQSTAYSPLNFLSGTTKINLALGYSGTTSFTDTSGHRVWAAWAVTAYPVKITGVPKPGDTVVCGTATKNYGITILDATTQPTAIPIGTGAADGNGNFCVTVSPALYRGEVLLAQDSNGTYSQPFVVGRQNYLPSIKNG